MQVQAGFRFPFLLAALMHGGILFLFTFTFSIPVVNSKPTFVFLGSFLRQQDVTLPSKAQLRADANLDLRRINLDSNQSAWTFGVPKPSLVSKVVPQNKSQFKPVVAQAIKPSQSPKSNTSDLGIEFEPLPPVKMKINRND
jgi:hypothetical protein